MNLLSEKVNKRKNEIITQSRDWAHEILENLFKTYSLEDPESINIIIDRMGIEKTVNDRKSRGDDSHKIRVNGELVFVRWNFDPIWKSEDDFAQVCVRMRIDVVLMDRPVQVVTHNIPKEMLEPID